MRDLILKTLQETVKRHPEILDDLKGDARWIGEVYAYKEGEAPDDDQRRKDEERLTKVMTAFLAGQFERVIAEIRKDDMPVKTVMQISFWVAEEQMLWDEYASVFVGILMHGVDGGLALTPGSIVDMDIINMMVINYARKYRNEYLTLFSGVTKETVQNALTNWIASGDSLDSLVSVLSEVFSKARAERIAVTEVTRLYAMANQMSWEAQGTIDEFRYMTTNDELVCKICGARHDKTFPLSELSNMIPAHVNCRCWAQPVVNIEKAADLIVQELLRGTS